MDRATGVVTAERFATGLTFDEYVRYAGSPENLEREAGGWAPCDRIERRSAHDPLCPLRTDRGRFARPALTAAHLIKGESPC